MSLDQSVMQKLAQSILPRALVVAAIGSSGCATEEEKTWDDSVQVAKDGLSPELYPLLDSASIEARTDYSCKLPRTLGSARVDGPRLPDGEKEHIALCPRWFTETKETQDWTLAHEFLHWADLKHPNISSHGINASFAQWYRESPRDDPENNPLAHSISHRFTVDETGAVRFYRPIRLFAHEHFQRESFAYTGAPVIIEKDKDVQQKMICEMTHDLFSHYENVFHPDIVALRDNCATTGPKYTIKNPKPYEVRH